MATKMLEAPSHELTRGGRARILVADDNVGLAELWSYALDDAGYEVTAVESGGAALAAAARHAYHAAVLDLQMPDMSGLDVFAALRADLPELEGILVTGHASTESAVEAVNSGMYSYLVKPVSPDMVRVMVDRAVERQRLLFESREQHRRLEAAYRRERRIAETLQRSLLPDLRLDAPGVEVACLYQAAMAEAEVGGDFYDVVELRDGLVGVVLGDVSGKGLDAAIYTALTKYTLRSYALEDPDPGRVLARLNRAFAHQSGDETFATLFFGVIDLAPGRITYASAGHEPALLHRPDTCHTEWLYPTGPIAGVITGAGYETAEAEFHPGDTLLLYTDGASDARCGRERLGTEGLGMLLREHLHADMHDTLVDIYEGVLGFCCRELRDDTALLLLRRKA